MTKARDLSVVPNQTLGMKNRLIDTGFIINQRGYASGASLSAGSYAHDRWKAGASGCTYTFTQGSLGVPITITITAGSLQQIIEGCNMGEGGTYILSWTGTAQARINGGSYSTSPLIVSGITAGANTTIEFGTGTVLQPQLEKGSTATSFDYRPYGTELALCQRYYYRNTAPSGSHYGSGFNNSTSLALIGVNFPVTMRTAPSALEQSGTAGNYAIDRAGDFPTCTSVPTFSAANTQMSLVGFTSSGNLTTGQACMGRSINSAGYLGWSAEL